MSAPITLFIADDHPIVVEGTRTLLERRPDIDVVGTALDPQTAAREIQRLQPDVVLLDLFFGDTLGAKILQQLQAAGVSSKIIIYTVLSENTFSLQLLKDGARGYLNKNSPIEEIVKAIRQVHQGKKYLSPEFMVEQNRRVLEDDSGPFDRLSSREYSVMLLLLRGARNCDIQEELNLCQATVTTYTARIFRKVGVKNLPELVRAAQLSGIHV